jgi:putative transposase
MARLARAVAPGVPHHITQRGNRRQQVFFNVEDYGAYIAGLATYAKAEAVEVLACCLMPNHVHLVLVPEDADGLGRAIGEANEIR